MCENFCDVIYYGSGTVINYGSGSEFSSSYGSGSATQKVTVPTVPVPQLSRLTTQRKTASGSGCTVGFRPPLPHLALPGTVINYGSGSEFSSSYGSGSATQKVTVPTVPVPVPQHCPLL